MQVNYVILPNSVVVNFEGKTYSIAESDTRYTEVVQAIKENKLEKIKDLVEVINHFKNIENLEIKNNEVYLDGVLLEGIVADRILQFKKENLPYAPLIEFARKLRLNPSFNSRLMLYKFLEHNGHPITPSGNFIAYRGVTEDYKDMHTRTYDNSVGAVCEMDRSMVDENPNNTCSSGLHVACYEYAKNFGKRVVEVEIDPKDVVAVPTDYNGTKMRVCKFKVVNDCLNIREEPLYFYEETKEYYEEECEEETEVFEELQLSGSSLIKQALYCSETNELEITFTNGEVYTYEKVPPSLTFDWESTESPGKFYNQNIKNKYKYYR